MLRGGGGEEEKELGEEEEQQASSGRDRGSMKWVESQYNNVKKQAKDRFRELATAAGSRNQAFLTWL